MRDLALVLGVICPLLQSRIIDSRSILPHSHRDLCKRVLIGVHGCILGREWGCSLVVLGISRGEKDFLHRMFWRDDLWMTRNDDGGNGCPTDDRLSCPCRKDDRECRLLIDYFRSFKLKSLRHSQAMKK